MSSGKVELGMKSRGKRAPEFRSEFGISVRHQERGKASLGVNVVNEEVGKGLGSDGLVAAYKDGPLCEHTNKSCNTVISEAIVGKTGRQIGDEVSGDMRPGTVRSGVRTEEARFTTS